MDTDDLSKRVFRERIRRWQDGVASGLGRWRLGVRYDRQRVMRFAGSFAILLFAAVGLAAQDANELLARGTALIRSKPAEAVKVLEEALRLNPELPGLRYQLGLALHAIGDEADAEVQLREAAARMPGSAAVRNDLGIVLFQMGNAKASIEEFRVAVGLAPGDPNVHFNLGEALARTGDSEGALKELRVAAGLAPGDTGLARLFENVQAALHGPESTIKVDVRQVLVPVVVTDQEGHHVAGLAEGDFKVFEDGVEQKIVAFRAETAGVGQSEVPPNGAAAERAKPSASVEASVKTPSGDPVRRTYLILIDTLHSSFVNFAAVREALVKLFRQERSEDSQYVVVAVGASPEMVLNVTRDPGAVLSALESKKFQKVFLDGQQGGIKKELERFRGDLNETRVACDHSSDLLLRGKCEAGMARANQTAAQIAELDRTLTIDFLRCFRDLVTQLARARDRRTIVFLSDGFEIVPGREAFDLVNAFFPYSSHCLVPQGVICLPHDRQQYGRMAEEFEPILRLAARSNITIDTIDSRGLYGQAEFDASNHGNSVTIDGSVGRVERNVAAAAGNTLVEIAEATGGTAFHDNNDLVGDLQRAFADGRDYYTVAYVSSNANLDGKFRAITVQVRDHKKVSAKRGYWATPTGQ